MFTGYKKGMVIKMVIIRMSGGLGNQMFQYALYLKLRAQGKEVLFDDINEYRHDKARPIMLSIFGINYPRATWEQIIKLTDGSLKIVDRIRRKLTGRKTMEYHECGFFFDEEVLRRNPAYLSGVFQSELYFKNISETVRETYRFPALEDMHLPEELLRQMQEYRTRIMNTESVSIHIRRGDYLVAEEVYGNICTNEYYEAAVNYILDKKPDTTFYLFSNDTKWVRRWIDEYIDRSTGEMILTPFEREMRQRQFVVIEGTTEYTGYLDMALMSMCRHNIIANSSFSWWGAWLNANLGKIVIAPATWLNGKDCSDVYTPSMVRIDARGEVITTRLK